jgi:hypothetical protein
VAPLLVLARAFFFLGGFAGIAAIVSAAPRLAEVVPQVAGDGSSSSESVLRRSR